MSKWNLLFNKNADNASISIHRHEGYAVIKKTKVLWKGWYHEVSAEKYFDIDTFTFNYELFLKDCLEYVNAIDCFEYKCLLIEESLAMQNIIDASLKKNMELESNSDGRSPYISIIQSKSPLIPSENEKYVHELLICNKMYAPIVKSCKYYEYDIGNILNRNVSNNFVVPQIITREMVSTINRAQLTSHATCGVDNTGNVRVWQAESVLLFYLLTNVEIHKLLSERSRAPIRILEIGGGMTGLCGLALQQLSKTIYSSIADIIVTDGNPECVRNQQVCHEMNQQQSREIFQKQKNATRRMNATGDPDHNCINGEECFSSGANIHFRQLRWCRQDSYGELAPIVSQFVRNQNSCEKDSPSKFLTSNPIDIILAADCLFFKEFHLDLLVTLCKLLGIDLKCEGVGANGGEHSDHQCDRGVDDRKGCVYLMQPRRSGTMQLFLDTIEQTPCFANALDVTIIEDFHPEITAMHHNYLDDQKENGYDPDIHQPILILLKPKNYRQ